MKLFWTTFWALLMCTTAFLTGRRWFPLCLPDPPKVGWNELSATIPVGEKFHLKNDDSTYTCFQWKGDRWVHCDDWEETNSKRYDGR